MKSDYFGSTDAELLAWSDNFSQQLTAKPTTYGITAAAATSFADVQLVYSKALAASTAPETRGVLSVADKRRAKDALIAAIRPLGAQINATMSVDDRDREILGLTVRSHHRGPTPVISVAPMAEIVSVTGRDVLLRFFGPGKGAKPAGAKGITVFSALNTIPSGGINDWQFEGAFTNSRLLLQFPSSVEPGTLVYITAMYTNSRGEASPAMTPISTLLQVGQVPMKLVRRKAA